MLFKFGFLTIFVAAAQAGVLLGDGYGLGGGLAVGGLGGGLAVGGIGGYGIGRQGAVDLWTPPKYEYRYAVADGHTADLKEQAESRIGDLTKSEYSTGEKDRITKVVRVIAGAAPIVRKGYY